MKHTVSGSAEQGDNRGLQKAALERRTALESLLRRISLHPSAEKLLLRGSLATAMYIAPKFRQVQDLDFLGLFPFEQDTPPAIITEACNAVYSHDAFSFRIESSEVIFGETQRPGFRYLIMAQSSDSELRIQSDIAFGDSVPLPPQWADYKPVRGEGFRAFVPRPEILLAWKCHGLFEWYPGLQWRVKDLYDIFLLMQVPGLSVPDFAKALVTAFRDRSTPWEATQRLLDGSMGNSKGSRRAWDRLIKHQLGRQEVTDLDYCLREVQSFLGPVIASLSASGT